MMVVFVMRMVIDLMMVLAVGDEDGASENDNCDGFVHFSITMT
jgi:hypothetical protein